MLTEQSLNNARRWDSIGGFRQGHGGTKQVKIDENTRKKMEKANISEDEYLALLVFAKHLPRGKRELKLNFKELRDQLISNEQTRGSALSDRSGLNKGGKVSISGIKELTQVEHVLNIKNKNRNTLHPILKIQNKELSYIPYPYFKNNFTI